MTASQFIATPDNCANALSASERRIDPGHDSAGFAAGKLMN